MKNEKENDPTVNVVLYWNIWLVFCVSEKNFWNPSFLKFAIFISINSSWPSKLKHQISKYTAIFPTHILTYY